VEVAHGANIFTAHARASAREGSRMRQAANDRTRTSAPPLMPAHAGIQLSHHDRWFLRNLEFRVRGDERVLWSACFRQRLCRQIMLCLDKPIRQLPHKLARGSPDFTSARDCPAEAGSPLARGRADGGRSKSSMKHRDQVAWCRPGRTAHGTTTVGRDEGRCVLRGRSAKRSLEARAIRWPAHRRSSAQPRRGRIRAPRPGRGALPSTARGR
jgi:hypothetical protein